jgi:hypothetical protein
MLDVYAIEENNMKKSQHVTQRINSFSMEETRILSCVIQHPSGLGRVFHFFEDNMLTSSQIKELLRICLACFANIEEDDVFKRLTFEKVIKMLEEVSSNEWGLRTVCD